MAAQNGIALMVEDTADVPPLVVAFVVLTLQ
jgi:hypothetical protein